MCCHGLLRLHFRRWRAGVQPACTACLHWPCSVWGRAAPMPGTCSPRPGRCTLLGPRLQGRPGLAGRAAPACKAHGSPSAWPCVRWRPGALVHGSLLELIPDFPVFCLILHALSLLPMSWPRGMKTSRDGPQRKQSFCGWGKKPIGFYSSKVFQNRLPNGLHARHRCLGGAYVDFLAQASRSGGGLLLAVGKGGPSHGPGFECALPVAEVAERLSWAGSCWVGMPCAQGPSRP
jgi:hypothetical protein